jgi:adenylate cyclase
LDDADGGRARSGRWRDLAWFALLAVVFLALTLPVFVATEPARVPFARGEAHGFARALAKGPVALRGQWRIEEQPGAATPSRSSGLVDVPGPWLGTRLDSGRRLPAATTVSYQLLVKDLKPGSYRLYVPPVWGGSAVYINGVLRSTQGAVGHGPNTSRYRQQAHDVPFDTPGGDLRIRIDISTYHDKATGMRGVPVLGRADHMNRWVSLVWARTFMVAISFLVIGLFALNVYVNRRSDKSALYLALGSLALMGAQGIQSFQNLLLMSVPGLSHPQMYSVLALCSFGALVFWVAYVDALFPERRWRTATRWVLAAILAATAWQLGSIALLGTLRASYTIFLFLASFGLAAVYVGVRSIRALAQRREGSLLFMIGQLAIVLAIGLQVTVNVRQIAAPDFTAYGLLVFAFTHLVLLARRWTGSIAKAETLSDELRQLLEVNTAITSDLELDSLLKRILAVTSRIIRADRSSLFLKDEHNPELAAMVAEGSEQEPIRVALGQGLAGYVFATGDTVNIPDAYADERFNRAVDLQTGYRTRSVLAVPVSARDGRRIGVMEALNRDDGEPFSAEDAMRMSAFGAQAAVAIDNARLFGEALAARNFDESILRSMSGGVIALDLEGRITKLNAAAAEILGASQTLLLGLDARALLGSTNPWLIEEIGAVADGGEPKLLLDVELVSARARAASANITITPLEGEEGRVGVLLVIEDISEEKRLQGAMRRFMTQEVVDQVMSRDDDALFGTACRASVLFADIRGFTTLAEQLSPRDTVETLNELFTELYEAVSGRGGMLDKYIGDAVMAVYGAPIGSDRDPQNALESALEMLRALDAINARRADRGQEPMRIGIGIATGEVVAGTIGSPKRMDYTVIGDSVNLAARLQELTKTYGVELLIDEATAAAAAAAGMDLREVDVIKVRGRSQPTKVFEVLSREDALA